MTKRNETPTFTVVAKRMTPQQARRSRAKRQMEAWNKARAAGNRYFYFDGAWYNTKKAGESDAYWGAHFKDNTTGAGASNVQTSVGGMWRGKQGVEGRYDDNGKWMTFSNNSNSGPIEARGNHHSNMRGYIKADLPTDTIVNTKGTNRGRSTTNTRTGVTVGNKPQLTDEERQNYPRRNPAPTYRNMNWDAADFMDALMPNNAISNLIYDAWDSATGGDYNPFIARSGFNPFGYAKDMINKDALGLTLRGIDAYTTLGMPRANQALAKLSNTLTPKQFISRPLNYMFKPRGINVGTSATKALPQTKMLPSPIKQLPSPVQQLPSYASKQLPSYASKQTIEILPNTIPGLNNSGQAVVNIPLRYDPYIGYGANILMQGDEAQKTLK